VCCAPEKKKQLDLEFDHTGGSSAEVKNEWSCTSICLHVVHRNSCTLFCICTNVRMLRSDVSAGSDTRFLHTWSNCFTSFDDTMKPGRSCEHLLYLALYRECLQHFSDCGHVGRLHSADLMNRFHYFTLRFRNACFEACKFICNPFVARW